MKFTSAILAYLSILFKKLRRLRQRPVDGRPSAAAPSRSSRRHQSLPSHGSTAMRLVLHDSRARRDRPTNAHLLHLVRQCVQQTHDLRRWSGWRYARYEYAAVVDGWTHAYKTIKLITG